MNSPHVADTEKERLMKIHQQLDPFELKMNVERKLKEIFKLVKVTSNVRHPI